MGSTLVKPLEDNFKKNQEFLLASQKSQFERQLHMQNIIREQMTALQIARARELFKWATSFYVTYAVAAFVGVKKLGRKEILAPLLPLTFALSYLGDAAYGSKTSRIKDDMARILKEERELVEFPFAVTTLDDIDSRRSESSK